LPAGSGQGNGTAGEIGARGVVASAGFGNGVATGDGIGRSNTSRGNVIQSGFGNAESMVSGQPHPKVKSSEAKAVPAEIVFKRPTYTEEAKKLRIEGEVLLEVLFQSSGKLHILRVVRGLGHGLDESAIRATEQRFKPALEDGRPLTARP
jgi:TonB family protein